MIPAPRAMLNLCYEFPTEIDRCRQSLALEELADHLPISMLHQRCKHATVEYLRVLTSVAGTKIRQPA